MQHARQSASRTAHQRPSISMTTRTRPHTVSADTSHSRLTHLAEAGVGLPMLMTKSRRTSLTSLAIYAKPTFDAVAAATAVLDPDRRH